MVGYQSDPSSKAFLPVFLLLLVFYVVSGGNDCLFSACQQFCLSVRSLNTFTHMSHLFGLTAMAKQINQESRLCNDIRGQADKLTYSECIIILISANGSASNITNYNVHILGFTITKYQ